MARQCVALAVAGSTLLVLDAVALAMWGWHVPTAAVCWASAFAIAWLASGATAALLGRSRIARLMLAFGCLLAADLVGRLDLGTGGLPAAAVATVAALLVPLQAPLACHLLLAFPSGLPGDRARRLLPVVYAWGAAQGVWLAVAAPGPPCQSCADNLLAVGPPRSTVVLVGALFTCGWLVLAAWTVMLLMHTYRRATARQRRVLQVPYLAIIPSIFLFVIVSVMQSSGGGSAFVVPWSLVVPLQVLGLIGIPIGFLVGLMRERMAYARVGHLMIDLGSPGQHDLTAALAAALEDPTLEVAYPSGDALVDAAGRVIDPPVAGRLVTPVGDPGHPLALLIHDRSLGDEPALLLSASSAMRLALENARLDAQVRGHLLEVQQSRARIVTAADEARRRLERDLHDGAQQRLLAVGMALRMMRDTSSDSDLLADAERELAAGLDELRELAAGIHPAVLTDCGLLPALQDLVSRMGKVVTLSAEPMPRLPPPIEAALYFATSEAVANALKHAAPRTVIVNVRQPQGRVVIDIADDGRGGADPCGAGLCGVADRLAAINGTSAITSRRGLGTVIRVEAPCA